MVGTDYVEEVGAGGVVQQVAVDINHPQAIGTWLRGKILEKKQQRERDERRQIAMNKVIEAYLKVRAR